MTIEVTEYERVVEGDNWVRRLRAQRLPPVKHRVEFDPALGYEVGHWDPMPEERWVIRYSAAGPVYIWAPQTQEWALARLHNPWDFALTKEEALQLLETLEPKD